MKKLFGKYKKVVRFIAVFSVVYFLTSLTYSTYIGQTNSVFFPDALTYNVSWSTKVLLELWSFDIILEPNALYHSQKLYVNSKPLFNIVEGCNGLSVIILFAAFTIALKSSVLVTITYMVLGSLSLYIVNILRLVFLALGYYYYPSQKVLLHDIVFPLIIYGFLLFLWILWIKINAKFTK